MAPQRSNLALATLALGAFVIGTAELVVVGILNLVAADLTVSISTAGWIVTAYALGISIGGPLLTAVTTRLGRRFLLHASLAVYVLGNIVAVVAADFGSLLVARAVTGTIHGLFVGVASMIAASLVPAARRGQAISMVFGGIAVSTVLGVPLGTLVGQAFGWQASFVCIIVLGVVALVLSLALVPAVPTQGSGGAVVQAKAALAPRVLATLAVGLLLLGGQFTVFTYLAVYLEEVTGVSGGLVSAFLLVYGIASAVGIAVGGRFADIDPTRTLLVANAVLVLALGALYLFGGSPVATAALLAVWGMVGFGLVPSFQLRVISLAGQGADLAATLGASAVNAGIAGGAVIGGLALAGRGVEAVVLTGLIICVVALPVTWASGLVGSPREPAEPGANATADVQQQVSTG
ncbi:MFS transporter [Micromonospora sp. WMMD1102]|uniref:MFS transporter n=1 Tax=Micromonospora sp. WMMD1102 TaxID=3016105 RepID=UPI0024154A59|nr:MFS transporter [Micromonospora sp. WMMD1102]MDG4789574.1 MFS transporter [Micromonospora sp. WMMD1102]